MSDFQKCIILNKTCQHLLPDFVKAIKDEINYLAAQERELSSGYALFGPSQYHIRRPFLTSDTGEKPPLNVDALARQQRKELNLVDIRSVVLKSYMKTDLVQFVNYLLRCTIDKRLDKLETKRDSLLTKLSTLRSRKEEDPQTGAKHGGNLKACNEILRNLRSTESSIAELRALSTVPLWLSQMLVSAPGTTVPTDVTQPMRKEFWEKRILKRYRNKKSLRSRNATIWLDLLWNVKDILTSIDWIDIANHSFGGTVSATNVRLLWHHRLRLDRNQSEWTEDQNKALLQLVDKFGCHGMWEEIAVELNTGRTAFECFQHWQTTLNPEFKYNRLWTDAEDTALWDILKRMLESYPPSLIDWDVVAVYHATRTARECMQRAVYLSPLFKRDLLNCSPVEFTPDEDLQLLIGVQRHGTGGGRVGTGKGISLGSWAVIATALPGRSVTACQHRYRQLCDQFQPWTYTEDRNLYRLRLEGEKMTTPIDWRAFYQLRTYRRLLPYFPDRSLEALRHRFILLLRWSRVWHQLRQMMSSDKENSMSVPEQKDDSMSEGATLEELKYILLRSPFVAQFIDQLRDSGVASPEAEAFRLLTSWANQRPLTASTQAPGNDPDFILLLNDLESGLLVPRPLVGMPLSQQQSSAPLDKTKCPSEPIPELSLVEARKFLAYTRVKQMLAQPVRRQLFAILTQPNTVGMRSCRAVSCDTTFDEAQMKAVLEQFQHDGKDQPKPILTAYRLLTDEHLFWMTFDQVMTRLCKIREMKQLESVAYMRVISPFVSQMMLREGSKQPSPKLSSSAQEGGPSQTTEDVESIQLTHSRTSPRPSRHIRGITVHNLTGWRRRRLLEIKRMLHMYGKYYLPANNAYALASARWLSYPDPLAAIDRSLKPHRYVPPVVRLWPPAFAAKVLAAPERAVQYFLMSARTCVRQGLRLDQVSLTDLRLTQKPSSSRAQPTSSTSQSSQSQSTAPLANLFPPTYASLAAFKALLLHLPTLVRKLGNPSSKFVETRERLQKCSGDSSHEAEELDPFIVETLGSPEYSRFISVGMSLFLWPAMLSCIPTNDFVEAGKRSWQEAFSELPESIRQYSGPETPPKVPRLNDDRTLDSEDEETSTDSPPSSPSPVKKPTGIHRKSRQYRHHRTGWRRAVRFPRTRMLTSESVEFKITASVKLPFTITLPSGVKTLYASGYRPQSILRLSK